MNDKEREFADALKAKQDVTAGEYFKARCGTLFLEWMVDAYWGRVTSEIIQPMFLQIHKELVERKQTEPFDFNDCDDTVYYIPCGAKKVVVHTTQSRDFLYVGYSDVSMTRLHIRRTWRHVEREPYMVNDVKVTNLATGIKAANQLIEYCDDGVEYMNRPSLDWYKSIKFDLDGKECYGDVRDNGYLLSFQEYKRSKHTTDLDYPKPRIEGSTANFYALKLIAGCFLPCIGDALDLDFSALPQLDA